MTTTREYAHRAIKIMVSKNNESRSQAFFVSALEQLFEQQAAEVRTIVGEASAKAAAA